MRPEQFLPVSIDPEDIFGYMFHEDCILILTESEDAMTHWLHLTRHGGEDTYCFSFACSEVPRDLPQGIYFLTEESWYSARTSRFVWNRTDSICTGQFILYKLKAQYMACASLSSYTAVLGGSADGKCFALLRK